MFIFKRSLLVASLLTSFALTGAAATIHPFNESSIGGFNSTLAGSWGRGWNFTVNADDVWVRELGMVAGSATGYTVVLWDAATKTVVASQAMEYTSPGNWAFETLSAAVELTQGSSYTLALYPRVSATYYWTGGITSGSVWAPTGVISSNNTEYYCNACSSSTYPNNTLSGYMYGIADIGYTLGDSSTATPEPASALFVAGGLGLLGLWSRRRS
jgi:MYXO-CTERM domain-containing protein